MKPGLLLLTFVFAALILLSPSVYAASLCGAPNFAQAVADAEVVFSGKITNVERVQTSTASAGKYVVTFKVDTWWKGKPSHETRVLWLSSILNCPFLPVGEVGKDYLVYADHTKDRFPEVTIFNRTSRLPANLKSESVVISDWSKQTRISPSPELNRTDASNDMKILRALRQCDCLSNSYLPPPLGSVPLTWIQVNSQDAEAVSACQTCLRGRLRPF